MSNSKRATIAVLVTLLIAPAEAHAAGSFENFGHTFVNGVRQVGHTVEDGAKNVGHKVGNGAKNAGHTIEHGAKHVGQSIVNGWQAFKRNFTGGN